MPYGKYAQCPCCGKEVYDEDIEKEFGYRNMGDNRRIPYIPQSYCRECRSAGCEAGLPCKVYRE